jgi:hypothetical protein
MVLNAGVTRNFLLYSTTVYGVTLSAQVYDLLMAKICPTCLDAVLQSGATRCAECDPHSRGQVKPGKSHRPSHSAAMLNALCDAADNDGELRDGGGIDLSSLLRIAGGNGGADR